jgi:hypothetical protein
MSSHSSTKVYPIGTQYWSRGRHPHLCTVKDILRTYSNTNELVRVRYVATHELVGQVVTDRDVVAVTIAMGLLPGQRATDAEIREELRNEIANTGDC